MENLLAANAAIAAVNALLLLVLLAVYTRMYGAVQSRFTLGLLFFAVVLLVHDAAQLYFYITMQDYFAGGVLHLVLVQNVLATMAVGFLTFATLVPSAEPSTGPADAPDSG